MTRSITRWLEDASWMQTAAYKDAAACKSWIRRTSHGYGVQGCGGVQGYGVQVMDTRGGIEDQGCSMQRRGGWRMAHIYYSSYIYIHTKISHRFTHSIHPYTHRRRKRRREGGTVASRRQQLRRKRERKRARGRGGGTAASRRPQLRSSRQSTKASSN